MSCGLESALITSCAKIPTLKGHHYAHTLLMLSTDAAEGVEGAGLSVYSNHPKEHIAAFAGHTTAGAAGELTPDLSNAAATRLDSAQCLPTHSGQATLQRTII